MSAPRPSAGPPAAAYPGQRLGLPATGSGAVAGWLRRILALCLDWAASLLAASAVVGPKVFASQDWQAWMPLLVFWVEASLLTALLGGSFGQLVVRVAVIRTDGRPLTLLAAVLRGLLVCLVVPPVIYNRDQRGLHDLAVSSVAIRR